ncbi:transcriptional regulator [Pseudomonas solani]|uniref:Transcriptional regulator n=1 Tax=Pseudomonas solani TaxID=2731552 RepID=A0AAU7XYC7_9PSED|nr:MULTISPECIES: AraC family transcriptional regulator [Pseudomonas]EQM71479.1 hypothetical protein L682_06100 [Pseudomonas alcaligenes OT 69]MBB4819312.1 AraC-like DNA-binding protein [Pseudomonas alcaligenes]MDN4145077.1 AraC family transcriptional regulator [Pseudomonas tohonis]MCU9950919.1 AraC family transcriptional regulator [Pseudomonas sp. PDM13]MDU9413168.1 AraC family transcriptional regulator [Pseudomonas sp. zfem005]
MTTPATLEEQGRSAPLGPQARLARLIERFAREEGVNHTPIPRLSLFRATAATEPIHCLYEPALGIVVQGCKQAMLNDETYIYGQSQYLIVSLDLPVIGQVLDATPEVPFLSMRLDLDPARISELLLEMDRPPAVTSSARGISVCSLDEPLQDAVIRLVSLLDTPDDIAVLAPLVEREILYRLLLGERSAQLRQIACVGSHTQRIAKAVSWLKNNYHRPLQIGSLAGEVNMSTSALHHHFKSVTAMSPLQFQKQLRLQEARRLMLAEALDAATAGSRVGYESPSQFSREYSRLFGEPPQRDIARLRQSA